MKLGVVCGVPVRLNPLTLPMLLIACWLGGGREAAVLTVCVLLHEAGHMLMARLLRVRVVELELMPVGGAARLESVWGLRPAQLIATALAGPAVNLLLVVSGVAAASAGVRDLSMPVRVNLALLLFNLLPALPMDGGRIVCAVLARFMKPERAAHWGVRLGLIASGCLLILSAMTIRNGPFNVTPLLAALFILAGAPHELHEARFAALESLINRRGELAREGVMPARCLAVTGDTLLSAALTPASPRRPHLYFCLDEELHISAWLTDAQILEALLHAGDGPVGRLIGGGAKINTGNH